MLKISYWSVIFYTNSFLACFPSCFIFPSRNSDCFLVKSWPWFASEMGLPRYHSLPWVWRPSMAESGLWGQVLCIWGLNLDLGLCFILTWAPQSWELGQVCTWTRLVGHAILRSERPGWVSFQLSPRKVTTTDCLPGCGFSKTHPYLRRGVPRVHPSASRRVILGLDGSMPPVEGFVQQSQR